MAADEVNGLDGNGQLTLDEIASLRAAAKYLFEAQTIVKGFLPEGGRTNAAWLADARGMVTRLFPLAVRGDLRTLAEKLDDLAERVSQLDDAAEERANAESGGSAGAAVAGVARGAGLASGLRGTTLSGAGLHGRGTPAAARSAVIQVLRSSFAEELRAARRMVCDEPTYVNGGLLGLDMPRLTAEERDRIASGGADREATITKASREFDSECGSGKAVICSRRAWVAQALRDAKLGGLTDAEVQQLGGEPVPAAAGARQTIASRGTAAREATIAKASREFDSECGSGKAVICSRRAWVAQALRDCGLSPLSDEEAALLPVAADPVYPRATVRQTIASASRGTLNRAAVIAEARRAYADEVSDGKRVLCSEQTWVQNALREHGFPRLTDEEAGELPTT